LPTHWLLDYFSHRADMPLYPGGEKFGLGMWNSLPLTLVVEFGLFATGLAIYLSATSFNTNRLRATPPSASGSKRWRSYGIWSLVIFLGLLYPASVFGPPPPSVQVLAFSAIAIWLTIPWAAWGDRQQD